MAFYEPDPTTLTPDEYVDPQLPVGDAVLQDLLALTTDERARLEEVGALWIWGAPVADETGVDDETGEAAGGGTGATDPPAVDVVRFQTTDGPIEIEVAVGEPDRRTGAVDVPVFGPGFMISEATAAELGLPLIDAAAVGLLPGPMTVEQQDRLVDAFPVTYFPGPTTPDTGMSWATGVNWSYVDPGTTGFSAERLQLIVSLVAIGFVLLVVAIGLALAATESKDERDVLLAIGARPASLRRVAATKASLLAVAGAAIALPTGLLPFWAVWRSSVTTQVFVTASEQWEEAAAPIALPWLTIAALVLVIPTVVGLGAWLASTVAHGVRPVRMSTLAED